MNNTIIFLSIFLFIINIMVSIKINVCFDLFSNNIVIKIFLYKLKIMTIDISILGLTYKINNSKKIKRIKLILNKKEKIIFKQIKSSIIDKIYYDDITLKTDISLLDAYGNAIMVGIFDVLSYALSNKLLSRNKDVRFYYNNKFNVIDKDCKLMLDIKFYFIIFDLIFAFILSFYRGSKYAR